MKKKILTMIIFFMLVLICLSFCTATDLTVNSTDSHIKTNDMNNNDKQPVTEDTIKNENYIINKSITNSVNTTITEEVIIYTKNKKDDTSSDEAKNILEKDNKLNGTYTVEDYIFNKPVIFDGNITLNYCEINSKITSYGNLTFNDCLIDNNELINFRIMTINDFTDIINTTITGNGFININNTRRILPFISLLKGNHTINNAKINKPLTITDTNIITNSIINSIIENQGILIIDDNTNFTKNGYIVGGGRVITNNTYKIINYIETYHDNITLENMTISNKINYANLTLINCNITGNITNKDNANLNIINSTLDSQIINQNANALIDKCVGKLSVGCNGSITIQNSNLSLVISGSKGNDNSSNITIINTTLYNQTTNNYVIDASSSNITVENSTFLNNQRAIKGNRLLINNSKFINNKYYDSSDGLLSAGRLQLENIHSEITVTNCIFKNNNMTNSPGLISLWPEYVNIFNCTFENNNMITNDPWRKQGGVAISLSPSDNRTYNITNNIFKNNHCTATEGQIVRGGWYFYDFHTNGYGTDINIDIGDSGGTITYNNTIIINNNQFINSLTTQKASSILLNFHQQSQNNIQITNNKFTNTQSLSETIILNNTDNILIRDNIYTNCTIDFNNMTIEKPKNLNIGDVITLKVNIQLSHPQYYDKDILENIEYKWYINEEIVTTSIPEISLTIENESMIIYAVPTITNTKSKLLVLTPTILGDKIITPENINQYLFDGELIKIAQNTKVIFQGEFNNQDEIYINTDNLILDGRNATFTNTTFVIEANNNTIQNMNIDNRDTSNYIITTIGKNNIIRKNNLTQYNTDGLTAAIKDVNSENIIIINNNINVTGPARDITYGDGATIANTQGILSNNATNSTIEYNNITINNSTDSEQALFGTIEAITAPQGTNNNINYNNINCTGARFNYGINILEKVENNQITYNNITVIGYRYADGIQVGNGATGNIIANNNINITCLNDTPVDEAAISYGIIITSNGGSNADNNTITKNNITINGSVNYGMEIYTATNTNINNNNIILTGIKSIGIGYAHSPNSTIFKNKITINDNSKQPLNSVTEEIQPLNAGIRIQQESDNIIIENNIIQTNDIFKRDKTINIQSNNITIKNNQLQSSTSIGDESITTTEKDTIINNNTIIEIIIEPIKIETIITMTNTLGLIDIPTTITAHITDNNNNNMTEGIVIFTDSIGNTLGESQVKDGIANINITRDTEIQTTITATYTSEEDTIIPSSTTAILTIQKPVTIIQITSNTIIISETVTLTATVTDQLQNNITGGKIIFKVNGKTVKDTNGKVIYAKVVDGIATVEYTVPDSLAGKDVNITVVYSGSTKYNKESTTITKTVAAQEPTLTITPITDDVQTGSTITLKAKVAAGDKAITTGKIVFKINGKTVKDANGKVIYAKVDANGEVSVDYNLGNLKAGTYTIEATFISPNYDKITSNTTMTVVKA